MIEVKDLAVDYGRLRAIKSVSLNVGTGELVTVVGPNGAGKSTLLRCILGLLSSSAGSITFAGQDITRLSTAKIVQLGLTLVPEARALFPALSVRDNLLLGAYAHRHGPGATKLRQSMLEEVYALFPALRDSDGVRAETLSGGQQQMVAIGRALMTRPKALLLDEPSLGLAPLVLRAIFGAINRLHLNGMSILLVEQNVRTALRLAQRAYVLETGSIVAQGRASDIAADSALSKAYFGTAKEGSKWTAHK